MTEASFPSAAFPDFPSVTIEHPAEWSAQPVAGALLAVIDGREAATFSPNVIVGVSRVGAEHTLADEVAAVADYVTRLPEVAPVDNAPVDFGDRTWGVAEFAYRAEGVGSIVQVIAVTVVSSGRHRRRRTRHRHGERRRLRDVAPRHPEHHRERSRDAPLDAPLLRSLALDVRRGRRAAYIYDN